MGANPAPAATEIQAQTIPTRKSLPRRRRMTAGRGEEPYRKAKSRRRVPELPRPAANLSDRYRRCQARA